VMIVMTETRLKRKLIETIAHSEHFDYDDTRNQPRVTNVRFGSEADIIESDALRVAGR
jgi:hypothetical protein